MYIHFIKVSKEIELFVSHKIGVLITKKKFLYFPKLSWIFISANFKPWGKPMRASFGKKNSVFQFDRYGKNKEIWVF